MSRRTAVDFRGVRASSTPATWFYGQRSGRVPFPHRTGIVVRRNRVGRNSHWGRVRLTSARRDCRRRNASPLSTPSKTPGSRPGIADRSPDSGDHISTALRSVRNARRGGTGAEGFLRPTP